MKKQLIHYMLLLVMITGSLSLTSCEEPAPEEEPRILQENEKLEIRPGNDIKSVCLNIYAVAKEIYLWKLPPVSEFTPEKYAEGEENNVNKIGKLLTAIAKHSDGDDQWSFVRTTLGNASIRHDLQYITDYDDIGCIINYQYQCLMVEKDSPAYKIGIRRGSKLEKNGTDFLFNKKNIQSVPNYKTNDILFESVFEVEKLNRETEKVGYFVYKNFKTENNTLLKKTFLNFHKEGITTLILDLRYNQGGDKENADYLLNLMLPSEKFIGKNGKGKLLSTTKYNKTLTEGSSSLLKQLKVKTTNYFDLFKSEIYPNSEHSFSKMEKLESLKRIYVIVSQYTASSSEYLIHVLKAYPRDMHMEIIGKQTKGKGVGSFEVKIGQYELHLISAKYFNAIDQSLPKDGYSSTSKNFNLEDDLKHELGDKDEKCLKAALDDIKKVSGKGSCCNMF